MSGGKECYPNSDVLINKYNIQDKQKLEDLEIAKFTHQLIKLDLNPDIIKVSKDAKYLKKLHKFLFGDLYEWSGQFRTENFIKSERVLSGASAEYSNFEKIEDNLNKLFSSITFDTNENKKELATKVSKFFTEIWTIHPFREGNTRTCSVLIWHYLRSYNIAFDLELLKNNPLYVRDSLVMANYGEYKYINKIVVDCLDFENMEKNYKEDIKETKEQYQITKAEYQTFKDKYIKKGE